MIYNLKNVIVNLVRNSELKFFKSHKKPSLGRW